MLGVYVGKLLPCHVASIVVLRRVAAQRPEGDLSLKRFSLSVLVSGANSQLAINKQVSCLSCMESWENPNTRAGAVEYKVVGELVSGHLFDSGLGDDVHFY